MTILPRAAAAAMLSLLLAACDGPETSLTTDRDEYTARHVGAGAAPSYEITVIARFTNHSSRTAHLEQCHPSSARPIYGVLGDSPEDESAWGVYWACTGSPPLEVAPGATRVDTLVLTAPNARNGVTGVPIGRVEGRHRIVYGETRVRSNAFRIRLPD